MKTPINKEYFGIVGELLARWKFGFWVVKWLKCLILMGFDDMWYDIGFEGWNLGFLLDFVGRFEIGRGLDF